MGKETPVVICGRIKSLWEKDEFIERIWIAD